MIVVKEFFILSNSRILEFISLNSTLKPRIFTCPSILPINSILPSSFHLARSPVLYMKSLLKVLLKNLEFVKSLLPDIGLGILFAFLGTYRTIINNYKSAKNAENIKVEKIEL